MKNYANATIKNENYDPRKLAKISLRHDEKTKMYYWVISKYPTGEDILTESILGCDNFFLKIHDAKIALFNAYKKQDKNLKGSWID